MPRLRDGGVEGKVSGRCALDGLAGVDRASGWTKDRARKKSAGVGRLGRAAESCMDLVEAVVASGGCGPGSPMWPWPGPPARPCGSEVYGSVVLWA